MPAISLERVIVCARVFLVLGCLAVAGCAERHGPPTQAYLKAERNLLKTYSANQGPGEPIFAPQKPILPRPATRDQYRAFILAKRQYPQEFESYYAKLIAHFKRLSDSFDQVQMQMGSLNAAGVDPEAVHLVATEEKLIGDMRLVLLEASGLCDRRRNAMIRAGQASFLKTSACPLSKALPARAKSVQFWGRSMDLPKWREEMQTSASKYWNSCRGCVTAWPLLNAMRFHFRPKKARYWLP